MADYSFHVKLTEQVNERIAIEIEAMQNGGCENFAEYRERCGKIAGLREALELAGQVTKLVFGDGR